MLFREAMDTPCGLRYMYDTLDLQSGAARRLLLATEMMTDAEELEEHYGKLREFYVKFTKDEPAAQSLRVKLSRLRDISGTASRLASGAVLDDVELFEVKNLLLLAMEVRGIFAAKEITTVFISVLCELPLSLLDPQGQKVPSFHVYDSYSEELATVRAQLRMNTEEDAQLLIRALELEDAVRKSLSAELRQHSTVIWLTLETMAETDMLLAQATQMRDMGLIFPEIAPMQGPDSDTDERNGGTKTLYEKMFNPQVKAMLAGRGKEFQPVDIVFGGAPVTIIGANMGGKTVALKTLGLCQLLFQFGFGIPAVKAVVEIKDKVLFCIGEEDRSAQGLSSFASEVMCLDGILSAAREDGRLLALVDEPARTTNPVEGTALVEAFIRVMARTDADLVATTHYNLKDIPGRRLRVKGLTDGKMDYRLEETTESAVPREALTIAESLGADEVWLTEAKEILANNNYK